nr:hypothetical protein CFP56_70489 [Quercus suber]
MLQLVGSEAPLQSRGTIPTMSAEYQHFPLMMTGRFSTVHHTTVHPSDESRHRATASRYIWMSNAQVACILSHVSAAAQSTVVIASPDQLYMPLSECDDQSQKTSSSRSATMKMVQRDMADMTHGPG